ncbi:TPA: hypothetical protein HA265_03105 [Candidatus Woesearchaeota archaeon]|nr:hypothetical protein [Candidatus Woesearchaeota archaeon]
MKREKTNTRQRKTLMGKKAQLTIFLILGVLLVATAALIYYFVGQREQVTETQIELVAEEVPNQVRPVKQFVEECMTQVSKEAIEKLGRHSGWIDPWDRTYAKKNFDNNILRPYEGDGVQFDDRESSFIPYYWYLKSRTDCIDCRMTNENMPRQEDVERQINTYVNKNLEECLDQFSGFGAQGFRVVPTGPIQTETVLTQNDVAIKTTYPLDVTLSGTTTNVKEFMIRQPVRLLKIMTQARNIAYGENLMTYLEYSLMNLVSVYSGPNTKQLPPFDLNEQSFVKRIWIKTAAKKEVQKILNTYTPMLRLNKTNNPQYQGASLIERSAYNSMNLNIPVEADDMEAKFYYFGWPIYFDITPNQGEILTAYDSERQNLLLAAPVIMQKYKFYYDVSWPVIVEIRNDNDFFGEGYSYMFALEGNVKDNKNLRDFLLGIGTIGPYTPVYEFTVDEQGQYDERGSPPEVMNSLTTSTLFCSEKQKLGADLYLNVTSEDPDTMIERARISFGCGMHAACDLGETETDIKTNSSLFEAKLPICMNGGYISIEVDGHMTKYIPKMTSMPNITINETISLKKYYHVNTTFKKLSFTRNVLYIDPADEWRGNYTTVLEPGSKSDLDPTDMLILRISRVQGEGELFPEQTQIIILDPESGIFRTELNLAPGEYTFEGNLFDKKETTIAPHWRCYSKGTDGKCNSEAWVPEEPLVMDMSISGGIEIPEEFGAWRVEESKLKNAKMLEMTLIQLPIPNLIEDLEESSQIVNLTSKYIDRMTPRLS